MIGNFVNKTKHILKMEVHKRSFNFTPEEVEKLMNLVLKYKTIIECKKTDSVYSKEKATTWEKIRDEYNASATTSRETQTLKTKYENIKKRSKQKYAAEKKQLYATGGGKAQSAGVTDIDEMVQSMLKEQMTGLESIVDSDTVEICDKAPIGDTIEISNESSTSASSRASPKVATTAEPITIRGNRRKQQQQQVCSEEWRNLAKAKTSLVFDKKLQQKELHELKIKQMQEEHEFKMTCLAEEAQLKKRKLELEIELIIKDKSK